MSERYWIIPVLIKAQPEELESIKAIISNALERKGYNPKHDTAREINPEWIKAENSPIRFIQESDYAMIKVGPEPKKL